MGGFVADDIVRWVLNNGLPPQESARQWQYWTRAAKWMNKACDDESLNKLKRIWQYNRLGVKDLFLDEAEIMLFPEVRHSIKHLIEIFYLFTEQACCKTHYYHAPFNFTHFALGHDNAYITGADIA